MLVFHTLASNPAAMASDWSVQDISVIPVTVQKLFLPVGLSNQVYLDKMQLCEI